jgi:hypothetical protein
MSRRLKFLPRSRFQWVRFWILLAAPVVLGGVFVFAVVSGPGQSHAGPAGPLPEVERGLPTRLRAHVTRLADEIGPRNEDHPEALAATAADITAALSGTGLQVRPQVLPGRLGPVWNLVAERHGARLPHEYVVVGAHYDSVDDSPGADDNASGVAALIELAQRFATRAPARSVRFIAFVNEEPPAYRTEAMGSVHAARASREQKDEIVAMFSLETIGYYADAPGSQAYPWPLDRFYPDTGDFIAFVGNLASRPLVQGALSIFRERIPLPSEGASAPGIVPGIGWSDHWSYWQMGYPAVMVTDTAPFRNPAYHLGDDRPATLDYNRMAWVTLGMEAIVERLANE